MILFGKPVAEKIYQKLKSERPLTLAVVLVGVDKASLTYVYAKEKIAEMLSVNFKLYHLSGMATQNQVEEIITKLNQDNNIDGIIIQLPLPDEINTDKILKLISPKKDIDGFNGQMPAPTAQAILEILKYYDIDLKNQKIVIVGHGRLVGEPLEKMLRSQGLKPVICEKKTKNLSAVTKNADILISATGVPNLIKEGMVLKNTVIIDAGTGETSGKTQGDVDVAVYKKVLAYSPTPGGVGPVTVACLMKNLFETAKKLE